MNSSNITPFHRLFISSLVAVVFYCTTTTTCLTIQLPRTFSSSSSPSLTSSEQFSSISVHNNRINHYDSVASRLVTNITGKRYNSRLYSTPPPLDDDIKNQLEKARKLLEEAKAKVAAAEEAGKEEEEAKVKVSVKGEEKREAVTKTKDLETGLITTDGELMAKLSKEEDWEQKELMDLFESESTGGRHDENGKSIADRDMAASVFNMRMQMMDQDYRRVFDKRNRFIGEDN